MSAHHSYIRPDSYLFLRLPTESLKLIELKVNTIIEISKLGSFPSNLLIGRPYHHTYEILDKREGELYSRLELIPPAELNAELVAEDAASTESRDAPGSSSTTQGLPEGFDLLVEGDVAVLKNNRLTIDDGSRQALSQADIEELKRTSKGKEIIEKILANHAGIDEKTAFSRAKYMLRKHRKYLKRITVLPMDLGNLIEYITEKEAPRILDIREETLGLVTAWSNAHFSDQDHLSEAVAAGQSAGKWLTVDETGGLVTAALAERMGILFPPLQDDQQVTTEEVAPQPAANGSLAEPVINGDVNEEILDPTAIEDQKSFKAPNHRDFPIPASSNTITQIHSAVQPNVSLLKYFGFDTSNPHLPPVEAEHPLHTHFKPLSWLQLLSPDDDPTYREPESLPEDVLATLKSSKRGTYFKKRRRWERCRAIIHDTQAGGFEGLVVASRMDPLSVLAHTVPLVRGGGHIVVYSASIEPLVKVMDYYSKDRRIAYIQHLSRGEVPDPVDFPVDPRLLLGPSLQTSRVRDMQVLPGRTHPVMTARGGAEGYVFLARRVIPLEGGVEARGNFAGRKRKLAPDEASPAES